MCRFTKVKSNEWYPCGNLIDLSTDSDESQNWSLGKLGDASRILLVAMLCKPYYYGEPRNTYFLKERAGLAAVHWLLHSIIVFVRKYNITFAICHRSSVCRLSSVTFVHPTQAIEIFGNISTPFGTLAIHDLSVKILRRLSQGNPYVGGVKHKKGSRI